MDRGNRQARPALGVLQFGADGQTVGPTALDDDVLALNFADGDDGAVAAAVDPRAEEWNELHVGQAGDDRRLIRRFAAHAGLGAIEGLHRGQIISTWQRHRLT